jgi:hypothetical protein
MKRALTIFRMLSFVAIFVGGCTLLPQQTQTQIANFIAQLNNTISADLVNADATAIVPVANAPGGIANQPAHLCLRGGGGAVTVGGLIGLQTTIKPIFAQATAQGGGAITAGVVLTTFAPTSPTMQGWEQGVEADCGPFMQLVSSEVQGTAGWFAALAAQFQLAALPAAARRGPIVVDGVRDLRPVRFAI